jgi:hypothetical protein
MRTVIHIASNAGAGSHARPPVGKPTTVVYAEAPAPMPALIPGRRSGMPLTRVSGRVVDMDISLEYY